ncbi:MAG: hypothetical protein H8E36_16535 [Rhodospirillaceae bacterium]|nr:hypothetical protein [Rhodospirillaceae bacterium]
MTEVQIIDKEAAESIDALWCDAFALRPFDAICTLLRVSGLQDAEWDPFDESVAAFKARIPRVAG